jgi:DNA-binding transcriptional regulator GbsR (MarR family)
MADADLKRAREQFISRWGTLGSSWGISRAMSQIHALLLVSREALSTDEVMDSLQLSRGSANTNLRELVLWGLIKKENLKGDRKDYFAAEKDPWKMFCIIARERKRREVDPMLTVLKECAELSAGAKAPEAKAFHQQIRALEEYTKLAGSLLVKAAASEENKLLPSVLKLFG